MNKLGTGWEQFVPKRICVRRGFRQTPAVIDSVEEPSGSPSADFKKGRRRKATLADPTKVDRLPPHSVEAEQGVLGCVMLSPHECLGHCVEKLKQGPEMLYDLRHRAIYEVLLEMYDKKEAIDLITLQQTLKPLKVLREMLRVGKRIIVAFPNFGHWTVRLSHLVSGRAPRTGQR